jgi:hypothetical protein
MGTVMKRMESMWNEALSCFAFVYAKLQKSSCRHIDTSYRANEWHILVDILCFLVKLDTQQFRSIIQVTIVFDGVKPVVLAVDSIVK